MATGERMETEKELVRDAFTWRYVWYDKAGEFTDAEREAREKRRGLWADRNSVLPWEWRREKRFAAGSR
jgi:micrococcal nuclease